MNEWLKGWMDGGRESGMDGWMSEWNKDLSRSQGIRYNKYEQWFYQIPIYMISSRMISYHSALYPFKWMSLFKIITLVYDYYCLK